MNFVLNILASVLGGVLLILIAGLVSQQARWILTGLLGRLLSVDIDYVFANQAEVKDKLVNDLKRSSRVAIMTGRGDELRRETFASLFHERPATRNIEVRILLPATSLSDGEYDWAAQREREVYTFDPSYKNGLLHNQIDANIRFLEPYLANGMAQLRRYNCPHLGRIIITDGSLYFTPYRGNIHGRECKVYKLRPGDQLYENLARLFDQLWNASVMEDVKQDVKIEEINV